MDLGFLSLLKTGGFVMYPLGLFSIVLWTVVFERLIRFRKLGEQLNSFQLEAMNALLQSDVDGLKRLCELRSTVPTAQVLGTGLSRRLAREPAMREHWQQAMERERQRVNQDLKSKLWILGTIASSAPFVGLFGTVVGILEAFHQMGKSGQGGFAVVASAISEALVATAAGILVAVIASLAFNIFQTRWSALVLRLKLNSEELREVLSRFNLEPGAH